MATYTADAAHGYVQPRANYSGPTKIIGRYVAGGVTISAGDVYQMVKIPTGSIITDVRVFGIARNGATVMQVGIPGNATALGSVTLSATDQWLTIGATASAAAAMPYTVSLSDDTQPQFVTLQFTVGSTASATATGTFGVIVEYLGRGQAGP